MWLRSSLGYSWGDPENTLSNYYFGGFGNNWVDYKEVRRFREYYSFPGIEINELGGNNFGKLLLECDLPPLRFKRAGIPDLYCTWASAAIFGGAIAANLDALVDLAREYQEGAGQLGRAVTLTGLLAWLDARSLGARFLLRMEDVDRTRCTPEAAEEMRQSTDLGGFQTPVRRPGELGGDGQLLV